MCKFTEQLIRLKVLKQKITAANKAHISEVLICVWTETSYRLDIGCDPTRAHVVSNSETL